MSAENIPNSGPGIREATELLEAQMLHPLAARSAASGGREFDEEFCPIRTAYQRDRDRILHAKAFRRLKHKTQMLIAPVGDHYRTRLTHSLEVAQVSRTIARALRLNEDLTESIALGHDLGHPPFGHTGEKVLDTLSSFGFHHQYQSLRIVRRLEPLNLTTEVLDGLEGITPDKKTFLSLEGQVVDLADRMAYLHHDVEDARRAGLMTEKDLPRDLLNFLGHTREARLQRMVVDLVLTTQATLNANAPKVALSPDVHEAVMALRGWMFEHIYMTSDRLEQAKGVERVISGLFEFYSEHPEAMSPTWIDNSLEKWGSKTRPLPSDLLGMFLTEQPVTEIKSESESLERRVVDYISGMTDRFSLEMYNRYLLPKPVPVYQNHGYNPWPNPLTAEPLAV